MRAFRIDQACRTPLLKRLADWLGYARGRERVEFLSRAANQADFERRLRTWEERERPFFATAGYE